MSGATRFEPPGPLVVSLVPPSAKALGAALDALARSGEADVVEVRLDGLAAGVPPSSLEATLAPLFAAAPWPVIAALHGDEGFGAFGARFGPDERRAILEAARRAGCHAVDVDVRFAGAVPAELAPRILSSHAVSPAAGALDAALAEARGLASERDLVKLVPRCADGSDALEVLDWLAVNGAGARDLVAFGTGEDGLATRLLAPALGGRLVYARPPERVARAALAAGDGPLAPAAPGQPTADHVRAVWAAGAPGPSTAIAAVVGRPIAHSASPVAHGAAAAALGLDAVLAPLSPASIDDVLGRAALAARLSGLSVTAPLKGEAIAAAAPDDDARAIGAANTLHRAPRTPHRVGGPGWCASNTDAPAVAAALERAGARLAGARALVVGAGGAARAAVHALTSRGASVAVAARRLDAAQALAVDFGAASVALADVSGAGPFDVVVHVTPRGTDDRGRAPVPDALLGPGVFVLDAVYRPARTDLARRAERAGATFVSGREWFLEQAWRQHVLLFPRAADADQSAASAARAAMAEAVAGWLGAGAPGRPLALVGLRGAGKSAVGARAAALARRPFIDLDERAAALSGAPSAGHAIESDGLEAFRDLESRALAAALEAGAADAGAPPVIACGGGVVEREQNRERLAAEAFVVWLDVDLEVARARVARDAADAEAPPRPALTGPGEGDEFEVLAARRAPLFEAVAGRRFFIDAADEGRVDALAVEALRAWGVEPPR